MSFKYKGFRFKAVGFIVMLLSLHVESSAMDADGPETKRQYLSGQGRDDAVEWDFFCTGGRRSGEWTKIPVPSQWELQGFGEYNYGHDKNKHSEQGKYRTTFLVPRTWKGRRIRIVFEGVMTDTEVFINGKAAGPVHQGGFYRFSFDISSLIKEGENTLEVNVSKVSANKSVEAAERQADYWVFGGIYRPVYLEALPVEYIDWTSVDARADGSFLLDVHLRHIDQADSVTARVVDADESPVGETISVAIRGGEDKASLSAKFPGIRPWTAESPVLYKVQLTLSDGKETIHRVTRRFGFRTFGVCPGEGLYLNGSKIRLKGVNRHCFRPDSGRCLSREISYADVRLIKEMNMNAVRMSHYPPDEHFLEACDELGLYVLDELAGWQKPSYDTETAERLIGQMIKRDQMHPCILFWDNANEGGWNTEVDDEFAKYDIQQRSVLHPWANFGGVNTDHYEKYDSVRKILSQGDLYMPTEFLHGLYDGGHGAGLNDYWNLLKESPLGAGGFLWVLADEGVVRTDRNGEIDTDGDHAPDGIAGPFHEKEGSFYTIKEIWCPVQVLTAEVTGDFNGTLDIENCYDFTDLDSCTFRWRILEFPSLTEDGKAGRVVKEGRLKGPSVAPGKRGKLTLNLPQDWNKGDALALTAFDTGNNELFTWTWCIRPPAEELKRLTEERKNGELSVEESGSVIEVTAGRFGAVFSSQTGMLLGLERNGKRIDIANGPRAVKPQNEIMPATVHPDVKIKQEKERVVLEVINPVNGLSKLTWTVHSGGYLEMDCSYECDGEYDFHGVTFDYPENTVKGKRWLGNGPYRVWKNRMKGAQFGLWDLEYNNTVPGKSWIYPEFKGYFSGFHWIQLDTTEGKLGIAADGEGLSIRLFEPDPGLVKNKIPMAATFKGDISFMHAIPAVRTKFIESRDLGPESQKTKSKGKFDVSLFFFAD